MAHTLGAAHALAGGLGDLLIPRLGLRMEETYNLNPRDNSPAGNSTVNMFIDSVNSDFKYAASVVTACVDQTVYAIQCTVGPKVNGDQICGPSFPVVTMTAGASFYEAYYAVTTETMGIEVAATLQDICALASTTAATCTATVKVSASGTSTSTVTVSTAASIDYRRFDVTITAGAEKI